MMVFSAWSEGGLIDAVIENNVVIMSQEIVIEISRCLLSVQLTLPRFLTSLSIIKNMH